MDLLGLRLPPVQAMTAVSTACATAAAVICGGWEGQGDAARGDSGSGGLPSDVSWWQWSFPVALLALAVPLATDLSTRHRRHPPADRHVDRRAVVSDLADGASVAVSHAAAAAHASPASASTPAPSLLPSAHHLLVWLLLHVCVDQCGPLVPRAALRWLQPLWSLNRAALALLTLAASVSHWRAGRPSDHPPTQTGPPTPHNAASSSTATGQHGAGVASLDHLRLPDPPEPAEGAQLQPGAASSSAAAAQVQPLLQASSSMSAPPPAAVEQGNQPDRPIPPQPPPQSAPLDSPMTDVDSPSDRTATGSSAGSTMSMDRAAALDRAAAALRLSASAIPETRARSSTAPPSPVCSGADTSARSLLGNAPLELSLTGSSTSPSCTGDGRRYGGSDSSPNVSPPVSVSPQLRRLDSGGRPSRHSGRALLRLQEKLRTLDAEYAKQGQENARERMFMACLCHELRNPLQVISANADFLLEDSDEAEVSAVVGDGVALMASPPSSASLTADQRELITSINTSAELMLSIVNDVLTMSRLQSGRMSFERLPLDLHWSCHSILNISRSQAASKGLRLELNIDEAVPRFVISDPTRIHQLLLNLISNAIKFTFSGSVSLTLRLANPHATGREGEYSPTPKEGPLQLPELISSDASSSSSSPSPDSPTTSPAAATTTTTSAVADGAAAAASPDPAAAAASGDGSVPQRALIEMEVADTGVGIEAENLSNLFTPFSQANSSTGREYGGSGLGLSICTQIVKNMAGTISVSSELGKGSRFTARLLLDVCDDESIRRGLGTSAGSYSNSPNLRRMAHAYNDATAAAAASAAAAQPGGEASAVPSSGSDASSILSTGGTSQSPLSLVSSTERILIVDDQAINLKLLQRMLATLGFRIDVAQDGLEAIAKIKAAGFVPRGGGADAKEASCEYLCVFLDLSMPRMNGWQCVSHIRKQLHLDSLPVIALTAESLEPSKAIDGGFTLSLAKPFRKPALLDILEPLLEAKRRAAMMSSIATTQPSSEAATPEMTHCGAHRSDHADSGHTSDTGSVSGSGSGSDQPACTHTTSSRHPTPDPVQVALAPPASGSSGGDSSEDRIASPLSDPSVATPDPSALPASPYHSDHHKVEGALSALIACANKGQSQTGPSQPRASERPRPSSSPPPPSLSVDTETEQQGASPSVTEVTGVPAVLSPLSRANSHQHVGLGVLLNEGPASVASERPSLTRPMSRLSDQERERDGTYHYTLSLASPASCSASPPLRPSQRQRLHEAPSSDQGSLECTPSSHRRSIRAPVASATASASPGDAAVANGNHSDTPPSSRATHTLAAPPMVSQAGGVARLRGGGTYSPLSLTASPRTVARHLVIEPASYPVLRRAATNGNAPGSPFNNGSVASSASMSSISDSILSSTSGHLRSALSGCHSTVEHELAGRAQHKVGVTSSAAAAALPPRSKSSSMGQMDLQRLVPSGSHSPSFPSDHASIPPLHPPPSPSVPPLARSLPSPSPSPAHSTTSASSGAGLPAPSTSPSSGGADRSHSPARCTSARSSPTCSADSVPSSADSSDSGGSGSGGSGNGELRTACRLNLAAHPHRSVGGSLSDTVDSGPQSSHDSASSRGSSDSVLEHACPQQHGSRSSSEGSVTPLHLSGLDPHQPHSACTLEEADRAKRATEKQRQHRSSAHDVLPVALTSPLDRLATLVSPPPLLAPPCTPLSPRRDDRPIPSYPNLDCSVQHFAYPRPFPPAVFRGAANTTPQLQDCVGHAAMSEPVDPRPSHAGVASTTDAAGQHTGTGSELDGGERCASGSGSESGSHGHSTPTSPPVASHTAHAKSRAAHRSNRRLQRLSQLNEAHTDQPA